MSNAAHAKTWQEDSLSDPGPLLPGANAKQLSERSQDERRSQPGDTDLTRKFDMNGLSDALLRLFDRGDDQFLWSLSEATVENHMRERVTRVDAEHQINRPADDSSVPAPGSAAGESWLVVVERAQNLLAASGVEYLRTILRDNPRTLLIALDPAGPETPETQHANQLATALVDLSTAMGLEHLSPGATTNLGQLVDRLTNLKRSDRAVLVHLQSWNRIDLPERVETPGETTVRETEPDVDRSLYVLASSELARRAESDSRIAVAVARADRALLRPWSKLTDRTVQIESTAPLLLQWSAALALEGGRPFTFLSLQELLSGFGQLLQDICLKRAPVTLVVRPHGRSHDDEIVSSAALAGFRQLPHLSVMSPKDSIELGQMLAWCANQDQPALVWLPDAFEPNFTCGTTCPIDRGTAESLGSGSDVVILAWGPTVAAATMAAPLLEDYGIATTVINCRFAQPLDYEGIALATRNALLTVVVDDSTDSGGFSSWVLDRLTRSGLASPVVVVSDSARPYHGNRHDRHHQLGLRIVELCRWVGEPLGQAVEMRIDAVGPDAAGCDAGGRFGVGPLGLAVPDATDEHEQVLTQQFSPFIHQWVQNYAEIGQRDLYLWQWCLHGLELTTLSSVARQLRADLCDTKLLAVMYGVMLDDVADQGGQEDFLNELTKIISGAQPLSFERFSADQQIYARFTRQLWETFSQRLQRAPAYAEYEELLAYDHRQILNTMSYSAMVNHHPELLNVQEHDMYLPHNMQMMSFATMDLMCSPSFDRRELGMLREIIWHAQNMGRIGNLVSTWQREIKERDFTSGVFARAIREGDLTTEDLRSATPSSIETAIRRGKHESYFLQKWESHRRSIRALVPRVTSIDVAALLKGLQRLIHMELGSRGFK